MNYYKMHVYYFVYVLLEYNLIKRIPNSIQCYVL